MNIEAPFTDRWREHPVDVLSFVADRQAQGRKVTLVIVSETEGGGLRAPGALAAVTEDCEMAGYVSNGCVDADVALQAIEAQRSGQTRTLRYGAGSPWMDIRLPCGGAMALTLVPNPDPACIRAAVEALNARQPLVLSPEPFAITTAGPNQGTEPRGFTLAPKLRLRVAGRGASLAATVRMAVASGFDVIAATPDDGDVALLEAIGASESHLLLPGGTMPDTGDDPWTAVLLLFHDHDYEPPLLMHAVRGKARFIGAMGSRKTHAKRLKFLADQGMGAADRDRIVGPVGLVGSLRDASMIAVSAMAQIVEVMRDTPAIPSLNRQS